MIKSLLFSLFLYVCLVWVGAAYLHPESPGFTRFGLFWTAAGLIALLLWLIFGRLLNWWRLWRARSRNRPSAPAKAVQPVHEEDLALQGLIDEANAALAGSAARTANAPTRISDFPVWLLVGPESSGKTSTFLNSGVEPQLLAGQVSGTAALMPTRLCNIWLAGNSVFIELSGRAFSADLTRWKQLLKTLRGAPGGPVWRRLLKSVEAPVSLRGVIAFSHCSHFSAEVHGSNPERYSRDLQDRLRAVAEVFEADTLVYQVISHSDSMSFFQDFFRRLPESEANQILGCTLPLRDTEPRGAGEVYAEAEARRLARFFNNLFQALASRRVTHLIHEPDPGKRPSVYEFPREFKRVRTPLVQFLTDVFRPNPLQHCPLLRGFYFTGVRQVEAAVAADAGETRKDWSVVAGGMEATRLFRSEATQMFRPGEFSTGVHSISARPLVQTWIFTSDLFNRLIPADRSPVSRAIVSPKLETYRQIAVAGLSALALILCIIFFVSWRANRELLSDVAHASVQPGRSGTNSAPTAADIEIIEALRVQVARLTAWERDHPPAGMRWGLYAGNSVVAQARDSYFRMFQRLILKPLNNTIVARLAALPASGAASEPYEPVYQLLKTHVSISSGACTPDSALIAAKLKEVLPATASLSQTGSQALLNRQIDFYASELPFGNPYPAREDTPARDHARQYLRNIRGLERIYAAVVGKARTSLGKPQRVTDFSGNYAQVLSGPAEVDPVFSRQGWGFVQKAAAEGGSDSGGEACVVGEGKGNAVWVQNDDTKRQIEKLFVRDYINAWRTFLGGFSVLRYAGPEDAARKLDILSGHKSPLLAVLFMASSQTNFPVTAPEPEGIDKVKPYIQKVIPGLKTAESVAARLPSQAAAPEHAATVADIPKAFQPVQWVLPPDSEIWVVDRNRAYMDGLAQLQHSMLEIARTSAHPDPAVHQGALQNYDKAMESVRQIARGFKSLSIEGLDTTVQSLLEQPIRMTKPFIITDPGEAGAAATNKEAKRVCAEVSALTAKYPFRSSAQDATVEEMAAVFAPASGAVWKLQAGPLADYVVKDGSRWKVKDPAKKPQITDAMLIFLNRAQAVADAFFAAGPQPHLTYTLRPRLDPAFRDAFLELQVDGSLHQWTSSYQKQFSWPAPAGSKEMGAIARIRFGNGAGIPIASRGGLWGVFRILADAEPRPLSGKIVEWKYIRGGDGRNEPIQPAPVRMDIVEFPAGVDLFNPKFFEGLQCPPVAVK